MSWRPRMGEVVTEWVPADGSDIVLFHDETRRWHRLVGTARPIWEAIDGTRTVDEIVAAVAAPYLVDGAGDSDLVAAGIAADTVAVLHRLRDDERVLGDGSAIG